MKSQRDQPTTTKQAVPTQSSKKVYKPGPTSKAINSTIRGVVNTKTHGMGYSSTNSQQENQKEQDPFVPKPLIVLEEEKKKQEEGETKTKQSQSGPSEKKEESVTASDQRGDNLSFSMKSIDRVDTLSEISDDASKESKTRSEKKAEESEKAITDKELEENVIIELRETETITLFSLPSRAIKDDSQQKTAVVQMNEAYQNLIKEKYASDSYQGRPAQTATNFVKVKEASSESLRVEDANIGTAQWEILDAFGEEAPDAQTIILKEFNEEVARAFKENIKVQGLLLDADSAISATAMSSVSQSVKTSEKMSSSKGAKSSQRPDQSSRSVLSSSHSINASKNSGHSSAQQGDEATPFKPPEDVRLPGTLVEKFNIIERILTQNTYLEEQILYRNYPKIEFAKRDIEEEVAKGKSKPGAFNLLTFSKKTEEKVEEEVKESTDPELVSLFQFHCPMTHNKRVCCADWNLKNPDLLAVSYGEFNHVDSKQGGLLLFWTLKSPRFPERSIATSTGLISCEFSKRSPSLIATGSYDGIVSLYDVRVPGNKPIADSSEIPGKHIDTVWEVRWVDTGNEEELISISSDGKVYKWSVKKGLEFKTLLTLKKPSNPNMKDGREGPVFREAVGFSVDPADNPIYYVSTEEGTIHKCSFSYTEELETYWGHTGPVYKVRCSPFYTDVFLSCSADWTCQLWHTRKEESIISCHSMDLTDAVNDVEWSPISSTVFAAVADDGRIEVWDIRQSTLKPMIYRKVENEPARTVVRFCKQFPVLVSGTKAGVIDVFRLKNMEQEQLTQADQRRRLETAINTNSASEEAKVEDEEEKA